MTQDQFLRFIKYSLAFVDNDRYIDTSIFYDTTCNERAYCYELYHKMRMYLHSHHGQYLSDYNISLTSELLKNFTEESRYPDFLLHNYYNLTHQIGMIEVKKEFRNLDLRVDLPKLTRFMDGYYTFQTGVFLCINITEEQFLANLRNLEESVRNSLNNNIVILFKVYNDEYTQIQEIINNTIIENRLSHYLQQIN